MEVGAGGEDSGNPPAPRHPPLQIEPLLGVLAEQRVDFVVIGGFALAAHGVIRGTKDIDIVPDPDQENIRRLASALRALDAEVLLADDFDPSELRLAPDEEATTRSALLRCSVTFPERDPSGSQVLTTSSP
jgi:hypothetical protein